MPTFPTPSSADRHALAVRHSLTARRAGFAAALQAQSGQLERTTPAPIPAFPA